MSSVLTYNGHGLKLMTGSGYVRVSGEKYETTPTATLLGQCKTSGNAKRVQRINKVDHG